MNNPWTALIIGLILGWLIELLIDVFYWRKRRLCPEDTVLAMRTELETAQVENGRLQTNITTLQSDLERTETQLGSLNQSLAQKESELEELRAKWTDASAELDRMETDFEKSQAEQALLQTEIKAKDDRIAALEAELTRKSKSLRQLRSEIDELDGEVDNMGLGRLMGGSGGLAIASFLTTLRNLFTRSEENDKNATVLAELETELSAKTLRIEELEAKLLVTNADLDNYEILRGDLEAQDARINDLEEKLAAKEAALHDLHTELAELDDEIDALGLGRLAGAAGGGLAVGGFLANLHSRIGEENVADGTDAALEAALRDRDVRISELEAQLDLCNASLAELQTEALANDGPSGLSMVWGLNTSANEVLEAKGIRTYEQLGTSRADEIDDALTFAQPFYPDYDNPSIHGSWLEQSRFAAAANWDGLHNYQRANFNMESHKDDLKKLWGIGPKIERVLNDNGIYLYSQIASVPADRITDILRRAGSRFRMSSNKLHESWPKQARLADRGEWDELKALTDKLSWSNVN